MVNIWIEAEDYSSIISGQCVEAIINCLIPCGRAYDEYFYNYAQRVISL